MCAPVLASGPVLADLHGNAAVQLAWPRAVCGRPPAERPARLHQAPALHYRCPLKSACLRGTVIGCAPRGRGAPSPPAHWPPELLVACSMLAQGVPSVARAAAVTGIHDPAFLEALADAAIKAMPQLSAADICSVVESCSGGARHVGLTRGPVQGGPGQACS